MWLMRALYLRVELIVAVWVIIVSSVPLNGVYIEVYKAIDNGGVAFTGNALGLDKAPGQNQPGNRGSIGAFITQDTSVRVNSYPYGTTLDYTVNGSSAYLDLPPGSVVIHAELVWSGSYGFDPSITLSLIDSTQVEFTTPDGTSHSVAPKPNYPAAGGTGQSRVFQSQSSGFYVRSQDVTSLVAADVANFVAAQPNDYYSKPYITGGVPATVAASANNTNCAGWTLMVAFTNQNMFTNQQVLYVACEASGAAPSHVTDFNTPSAGTISGRIFASALEGDSGIIGDQFRVGPGSANPPTAVLSGTNNPANNFFGSQINTVLQFTTDVSTGKLVYSGSGLLDTRGSFGNLNADPFAGTNATGARHGHDITSIDISGNLVNNQIDLYAQGTTTQDVYTMTSLGLQIQQHAPVITSTKATSEINVAAGDSAVFTMTFENTGTEPAVDLTFFDILPTGLTFTSGTFNLSYNGGTAVTIPINTSDLVSGVDLSSYVPILAVGDTVVIELEVFVVTYEPTYLNAAQLSYGIPNSSLELVSQTNTVTLTGLNPPPPPVATPDSYTTAVDTLLSISAPGLLTNDTGTSIVAIPLNNVSTTLGGLVSVFANGSFEYTPPSGYSGAGAMADSFDYTIQDLEGQTSTTSVTIDITPIAKNDAGSVAANTPLNSQFSVFSNDLGTTPFSLVSYTQPTVAGSTVIIDGSGNYTYTPAYQFSGVDTFTYTMADASSQEDTATVTINVLPVAADDVGVTPANTTLNGSSVFSNDPSIGTLDSWQNPSSQGGSVTMVTSGTNAGDYTYIPSFNFSGIDTFTYTVSDGVNSPVMATVHITVTPIANPDTGVTQTNTPLNQTISVLVNDIGDGLSVASTGLLSTVQGGTVLMNSDGTYLYTPPLNESGSDTFNYTLQDQAGSESTTQVSITILPAANNDSEITFVNTSLNGPSVLANDVPTDLVVVSAQSFSQEGGIVSMDANGTYFYTPPSGFIGIDQFSYTAQDPDGHQTTATVTIHVIPRPQPPPPEHISAHLKKCQFLNRTEYKLVVTWSTPATTSLEDVVSYKIYRNGSLVMTIPANFPLTFEKCSSSKSDLYGYEIASVNIDGTESVRVKLQVTYE